MLWGKQVRTAIPHQGSKHWDGEISRNGLSFWVFDVKFKQEVREAKRKWNSQL